MEKPLSLQESSKSPKTMKKFLHKRKTERKASEEEYVIRKSMCSVLLQSYLWVN